MPVTLQSRVGIDSNPLRLAQPSGGQENQAGGVAGQESGGSEGGNSTDPGQADVSAILRPTINLRCAATHATSIWASYALGIERFKSTSLLNTTAHMAELRVNHRLGNEWIGSAFGGYERSNQPDVLGLASTRSFATFQQQRGGVRMSRTHGTGNTFAEYSLQRRRYDRALPSSSIRQNDTLHSITFGHWWTSLPTSLVGLRLDYRQNQSNDPIFRYREPIVSMSYIRELGSGFRFEATPRVRWIEFAGRPVTSNPDRRRSDFIAGFTMTARQEIRPGVAVLASYGFDKDFSTEPLRRFNDHRISIGFDVTLGSRSRRHAYTSGEQDEHSLEAIQLANRGYAEITRGNWNEALRLSGEAIRLDPLLPEAHTNAGIAYYKLGRRSEAIEEWRKSLALRPDEKVRNLLEKVMR